MAVKNEHQIVKMSPPPRIVKLTEQGKVNLYVAALAAIVLVLALPVICHHTSGRLRVGLCVILTGYLVATCMQILLRMRSENILLRTGEAAIGRIGSISNGARGSRIVTCSFLQGSDPTIANFRLTARTCAGKAVGGSVVVLYNPKKPEHKILFESLLTVQIDTHEA
jgi:hypothetical protein